MCVHVSACVHIYACCLHTCMFTCMHIHAYVLCGVLCTPCVHARTVHVCVRMCTSGCAVWPTLLGWPSSSSAGFSPSPGKAPCCLQSRCFSSLSPAGRLQANVRRWRPHQQGDLTVGFQQGCDQPWFTFLEGLGCHLRECGGSGRAALGTRSEAEVPGRCQADKDGMAHCTLLPRGRDLEPSQPVAG